MSFQAFWCLYPLSGHTTLRSFEFVEIYIFDTEAYIMCKKALAQTGQWARFRVGSLIAKLGSLIA